jgi:malonate transporter
MSHVILLALAPIFFVMVLGYVAGRLHRIDERHVAGLNSLVMEFSFGANYRVASAEAGSIIIASTAVSVVTLTVAIAVLYPQ